MSGPQISSDGQFSIANVPPGDYSIEVVPRSTRIRPAGSAEFDEVASVPFTAAGQDITDLIITTTPGATVTGRVIFEGTSKAARPDRVVRKLARSQDERGVSATTATTARLMRPDAFNFAASSAARFS